MRFGDFLQMGTLCDACHREYTYHFHAFLDISLVGRITVLTTEISLLSHSTTLYEGLLLLFTPILTYEIIHIIASDMVVLETMI